MPYELAAISHLVCGREGQATGGRTGCSTIPCQNGASRMGLEPCDQGVRRASLKHRDEPAAFPIDEPRAIGTALAQGQFVDTQDTRRGHDD